MGSKQKIAEADAEAQKQKLNEVIIVESRRADGSLRIQQDFSNCPTMAEQHTAHLTNINWLMERYQPDELAQYMAARAAHRQEILGHDFSAEPSLMEARNFVIQSKNAFESLPDDIRNQFKNHVEFLKFIDNPANVDKMLKLGILTQQQVTDIQIPSPNNSKEPGKSTQNLQANQTMENQKSQ